MTHTHVQCHCGANRYRLTGKPVCRFICHCQICQAYTRATSSDVMVVLARDVHVDDISQTRFKRWRMPPNIRRGTCRQCNKPVIEFGAANQLVFVPVPNVQEQDALPPTDLHLFYNRRCSDAVDPLPKLSGYVRSNAALMRLIGERLVARLLPRD